MVLKEGQGTTWIVALYTELCRLGFSGWVGIRELDLLQGDPAVYCLFIRFLLQSFPVATLTFTRCYDWFLVEGDNSRLVRAVLRLLREKSVGPNTPLSVTATQFLRRQYANPKAGVCLALLHLLRETSEVRRRRDCMPVRVTARPTSSSKGDGMDGDVVTGRRGDGVTPSYRRALHCSVVEDTRGTTRCPTGSCGFSFAPYITAEERRAMIRQRAQLLSTLPREA